MDIIRVSSSNTLNCINTYDIRKENNRNDENSDTSKVQGIKQDLGNDRFVKSLEEDTVTSTYNPLKKRLSAEDVKALKEEQETLKIDLIRKFINNTINNQNKLLGKSTENQINEVPNKTTDLLTKIFGSVQNAYPELATTPEGAAQAIAEGGAYSVNAVADRIMTMAKYIAGDDPTKIQQMREAVEKGFSQAGFEFNKATNSELPQICKDTIAEVLRRFDELQDNTRNNTENATTRLL